MNKKDIDSMLENLSHSDMNYAEKINIKSALQKNDMTVFNSEVVTKRNMAGRVAVACIFSAAIVSAVVFYNLNQNSVDVSYHNYDTEISEITETAETTETETTEITKNNNVELPDIPAMDRMSFMGICLNDVNHNEYMFENKRNYIQHTIDGTYDEYIHNVINSVAYGYDFDEKIEYVEPEDRFYIEGNEKCSEIIDIIRKNCIEICNSNPIKDKFTELYGECEYTDKFPYAYIGEDYTGTPNHICFEISDDMEIIITQFGEDYLFINQNGESSYYILENGTFSEIIDIILDCTEDLRTSLEEYISGKSKYISCRLIDETGNEIPIEYNADKTTNNMVWIKTFSRYADWDLKNGFYTPCNVYFSFFDEYGNEIEERNGDTYFVKCGVYDYKISIGINAEAIEPFEWDTMRVRIDDIIYTDSYTNEKDENYKIPLTMEFEYKNTDELSADNFLGLYGE